MAELLTSNVTGTLNVSGIVNIASNIANAGNILVTQNIAGGNIALTQNATTGNINVSTRSFEGNVNVYFTANVTNGNIIANSYQYNAPTSLAVTPTPGTVANVGTQYAKNVANAILFFSTFPMANNLNYNSDVPEQSHLGYRDIYYVRACATNGANTAVVNTGGFFSDGLLMNLVCNAQTIFFPTNTSPILKSSMTRLQLNANSTLMGNANAIFFSNQNTAWSGKGSGAGNGGGFLYTTVFSIDSYANTNTCFFAGMSSINTASLPFSITANADPISNTRFDLFGVGANINTGSLQLIFGPSGGTRNLVSGGANFTLNTNDVYELTLFAPPNGATIAMRVRNLTNGAEISANSSSNVPTTNTFLQPTAYIQGNTSSTGTATATLNAQISIMRMYLEKLY